MFENYYFEYCGSIISSKLTIMFYSKFPKFKKIVVFFIINLKYYRKNILLLYIIINLCFYCNLIFYNREIHNYQILKFSLRNKKIYQFFDSFVNIYLPILEIDQNVIKKSTIVCDKQFYTYRFDYFTFPVIPESDVLCYNNELIFNIINQYQIRFDVYLTSVCFIKNSLEFLFRLFRLPVIIRLLKK